MNHKAYLIAGAVFLVVVAGMFVAQRIPGNDFGLPESGDTQTTTIVVEDGRVVGEEGDAENPMEASQRTTKEIMVTDGTKHSIPLEDILQGCPGRDCIPSIDAPEFGPIGEADAWLDDIEPGIAFSKGDTSRFYPFQVLVRHELVNDVIEGERVLISYCPLCLTAVAFDPVVPASTRGGNGVPSEFGVSGLLWESNLIMYDRETDNLWSQVLGEAVVGESTGTKLKVLPSDVMRYENFKKAYPNGEVLSGEEGGLRSYGRNPYGGSYFDLPSTSLHFANPTDDRLPFGAFVFGIERNGRAKAYDVEAVKRAGVVEDEFEDMSLVLRYEQEVDIVRMFQRDAEGVEERIIPISGFWFSWVGAHPETELYR